MSFKLIFLIEFIIINSIIDVKACENILSMYEKFGCKHVNMLANESCTGNFECPDFNKLGKNKCFWNGKTYNINEEVVDGLRSCEEGCSCTGYDGNPPYFSCNTIFDCPENFGDYDYDSVNCIKQYEKLNQCCISSILCGHENITKSKKCYIQGRIYSTNEEFSINGYKCLCTENFDNTTLIAENSNCIKILTGCGIESSSHTLNAIRKGCAPVFKKTDLCPIEYKCPSNDEAIDPDTKSNLTTTNDATCVFGNLILKPGEQLVTDKSAYLRNKLYGYTECKCQLPPFITCIKSITLLNGEALR